MTKKGMIILRANILGGFDDYIRDVIGDDDLTDWWNNYGVPDGANEADLMELAEDNEFWKFICEQFGNIILKQKESNYEWESAEE